MIGLIEKLKRIAKNTPDKKKAKMLVIVALRENKKKYAGHEIW